jgi:hypothetical protein
MNVDILIGLAETIAIISGLIFAIVQIRTSNNQRSRESAYQLLNSFQTPEFHQAVTILVDLPEGLSKEEIEEKLADKMICMYVMFGTFESLGILIFRREITLQLVEDFFSGVIVLLGRKFKYYFKEIRELSNRPTYYEWIQWMYEQIERKESLIPAKPAYVEYRGWNE